jgi:hypothetical protein
MFGKRPAPTIPYVPTNWDERLLKGLMDGLGKYEQDRTLRVRLVARRTFIGKGTAFLKYHELEGSATIYLDDKSPHNVHCNITTSDLPELAYMHGESRDFGIISFGRATIRGSPLQPIITIALRADTEWNRLIGDAFAEDRLLGGAGCSLAVRCRLGHFKGEVASALWPEGSRLEYLPKGHEGIAIEDLDIGYMVWGRN